MLKIIEGVKDANEKDCPLPALALALTLPDICSQIEYPHEKNVGNRYEDWYDNFIYKHENDGVMFANFMSNQHDKKDSFHRFNGYVCYTLRCLLLHRGDAGIDSDLEVDDVYFRVHTDATPGENKKIYKDGKMVEYVSINSKQLCHYLCDYALKYYENSHKKEMFNRRIL